MAKKVEITEAPLWAPFSWRELGILFGVAAVVLLPLLNKAYHVDDPLFVWTAQRVLTDPLNFYGFHTNWGRAQTFMYSIMQNPPLTSFYLAPFGALFGWREPVMHLAMFLPTLMAISGAYMAARRFCAHPFFAAALAMAGPGFLLSSAQVMSDVPMVGCWSWALYFWMRGLDEDRIPFSIIAGIIIAAGELTKYFDFSLVPLLLVFTFLAAPKRSNHLYCLLIPFITLLAFEFLCYRVYGIGLLADALRFARQSRLEYHANPITKFQTTVVFAGGVLCAVTFLLPWLWNRKELALWAALFVGIIAFNLLFPTYSVMKTVFLVNVDNPGQEIVTNTASNPTLLHQLQWALWTVGGLQFIALAISDLYRRREAASVLFALWIAGTFFFVVMINHFVNARVVLPMGLAVALLAVRRMEDLAPKRVWTDGMTRGVWAAAGAALVVSILLNYVDYRLAGSARTAATQIMSQANGRKVFFSGHSGWQYYMEALGGKAIDQHTDTALPGDMYVLPSNNWQPIPISPSRVKHYDILTIPASRWATTSHYQVYAGFYSDGAGPMPFYFGPVPEEKYVVVDIGEIRELPSP